MTLIPTAMARELSTLRIEELHDHARRARSRNAGSGAGGRELFRPAPVPRPDRSVAGTSRPARTAIRESCC